MRKRLPGFYCGPVDRSFPDWCTEDTARKLAARIEHVWHSVGHTDVSVWVERQSLARVAGTRNESTMPVVRTNLVNGLPPSMAAYLKN